MRSVFAASLLKPYLLIPGLLVALSGCSGLFDRLSPARKTPTLVTPELADQITLTPTGFDQLPGFGEDALQQAHPALTKSCEKILKRPAQAAFSSKSPYGGRISDWQAACTALETLPDNNETAFKNWLTQHFTPYSLARQGKPEGIFTGYFEAALRGSYQKGPIYRHPIYALPGDLVKRKTAKGTEIGRFEQGRLVPYFDRAAIDNGAIAQTAKPILWADDPVDVLLLHIQGSGQVELPDGRKVRLGFAGSNGLPFQGIARTLLDEGLIRRDQATMDRVRDWLRANPAQARPLIQRNRRFIFFREVSGDGPVGALSVPLTAGRSLAVDPDFIPLGAPLWLDTSFPAGAGEQAFTPLRRLMVAQDTGYAIKGPVRGDFYWGSGEEALTLAGGMQQRGRYFLLLPKDLPPPE